MIISVASARQRIAMTIMVLAILVALPGCAVLGNTAETLIWRIVVGISTKIAIDEGARF